MSIDKFTPLAEIDLPTWGEEDYHDALTSLDNMGQSMGTSEAEFVADCMVEGRTLTDQQKRWIYKLTVIYNV